MVAATFRGKRRISILGSTGSVGKQTVEVVREHPERFQVVALSARGNVPVLEEQVELLQPQYVAVADPEAAKRLAAAVERHPVRVEGGPDAIRRAAVLEHPDLVVNALVGFAGLEPTMDALNQGINVALANKETLVVAGQMVTRATEAAGVKLLPIDSEHSAIFQCLEGQDREDLEVIHLTASGGPFRQWNPEKLAAVTAEQALNHPNWQMGSKITVDSATMMNKGLEILEACWLFGASLEQVRVLVHPQSIIHSLVEFRDGSVLAQLGVTDMKLPIQYALSWPERWANSWPRLNLAQHTLTFEEPDPQRFPCLALAYEAGKTGQTMPVVLNAANEVAVEAFLEGRITFPGIPALVRAVMQEHCTEEPDNLPGILRTDAWARKEARSLVEKGYWSRNQSSPK